MSEKEKFLLTKSAVAEFVRKLGVSRIDGRFMDALNSKVKELLKAAVERMKANGRSTIRPNDL